MRMEKKRAVITRKKKDLKNSDYKYMEEVDKNEDEQEEDNNTGGSSNKKRGHGRLFKPNLENHINEEFIQDKRNPNYYKFVGFSITDMFHCLKRKCIGIGLKGSCCLSLLALLKAAGVEQPKFR